MKAIVYVSMANAVVIYSVHGVLCITGQDVDESQGWKQLTLET